MTNTTRAGLIDRVRRGHYALRQLGMLGTPAAAEDVAMSVSAAFKGLAHRMAYRSALYEHDLLVHPPRAIQVAAQRRVRTRALSGRRLQVVIESPEKLDVGRIAQGDAYISDLHRAILDAAHRPRLGSTRAGVRGRCTSSPVSVLWVTSTGWCSKGVRRSDYAISKTIAIRPISTSRWSRVT